MTYRSRNAIARTILGHILEPTLQTEVMYHARLSFAQLAFYRDMLVKKELVSINKTTGKWTITEKGRNILERLKQEVTLFE